MTNRTACAVERSGLPTTQFTFVEALEGRLLLNGVPSFATALGAQYSVAATGQALAIGIDGAADSGDALTITALSDDPNLQAIVLPDTRFAQLHFVAADGTDIGDVLVELFDSRAPTAAERFATLATTGYDSGGLPDATASPFYTDVLVHRIIPNFMVQTGDAQKGDGTGGSPLGAFNETLDPNLSFSGVGVLAMANSGGPSSSDCQFFITNTAAHWLDGNYIIFGQVISGMDIVSTLIDLPRDSDDRPYGVPVLQSVSIIGSDQDGVVLLIPQAGFDGSATVTISLNDEGTSQTTSQDIAVVSDPPAGSMGVITLPEQETFASPGSSFQFTAQISPPSGVTTMHVAVESDKPGVTASIDPVTYEVTVNVAGDFTGAARLRVTAWPDGYDNYANWPPAEGVVYVNATGQVTIDDPGLLHVAPGVESTFTATASGQPTGLEATTSLTGAAVSTEPGLQYNITAPADFTGVFQAQLTASQGTLITGESGYVQAATRSVTVSSQNAADPPALQAILGATNGTSYATVVDGNTLYEADGALGLRIYDISDPQAPVFLGSYGTLGQLRDLKLIHRTISGSDHTIALLADIYSGIISVDVTDPTDPAVLDTVTLNSSGGEYAVALAVAGNVAYVAEYGGGLVAYDITDPAQITKLGSAIVGSEAVGIAILGRYAFVSDANGGSSDTDGWAGVIVVDIAKPAAMNAVSSYSTDVLLGQWGSPWGLTVAGNRLYVADQTNGLLVYDMANPVKGKYLGRFADDSPPWQVTVANQVALITGEGVKFIDASNPANMSVLYSYQTPDWVGQIGAYRGHLALPVSSLGVVLMDASDLLNHTTVSTSATFISDSGVPVTVKISGGGKLVVTTTGSGAGDIIGIDVVNSTAKTSVSISAKTSLPYSIGGITVDGSIAKFLAPGADLAGDFVVQGVIGTLSLHNVTGYDITLHDNAALSVVATTQAAITANNVTDCQLDANDEAIKSLTVGQWLDVAGPADTIESPLLGALTVKGPFEADLTLAGNPVVGKPTLGKATISGAVSGTTWHVHGSAGAITINGAVGTVGTPWTLDQATTVASLTLGNIANGVVAASGAVGALKAVRWADGSIHAATLASLSVTGVKGGLAGDFGADLTLDGPVDPTKPTVGNMTVAGALTGGIWTITGKVGKVSLHDVETSLNLPAASLAGFLSASPMVKVTILGVPAYLLAIGEGGTLYKLQFGSLAKWPVTTLTQALAPGDPVPTSSEVLAALTLKSIKNQFVAAGLGAWTPTTVLKPGLLPSFTKSTDPLSTAGANAKVAYIYDNALAIGALLEGTPDAESVARAFQIADAFVLLQDHDPMNAGALADGTFASLTPAPLRDGYGYGVVAATRTAPAVTLRNVGTNNTSSGNQAYVAMALLNAADAADAAGGADNAARAADYRTTAKELLLYVGRQRAFGGAMGGFSVSGDPVNGTTRSTEHNIDLSRAFAALADEETDATLKTQWQTWQASAETFRTAMYGANANFASMAAIADAWSYFAAGANPAGTVDHSLIPVDTGAWSSLGLDDNSGVAFDFLEFLATSTDANGRTYTGFDPGFRAVADPGATGQRDGVGSEATAYMALIAQKLGDTAVLAALGDRSTLTAAEQSAFDAITAAANAGATDHDLADYFTRQLADIQLYAPNANTLGLVASPVKGTGTGEYTLINGISLAATCWARFAYTGWNVLTDSAVA